MLTEVGRFDSYEEAEKFCLEDSSYMIKTRFWDDDKNTYIEEREPSTLSIKEVFVKAPSFKELLEEL